MTESYDFNRDDELQKIIRDGLPWKPAPQSEADLILDKAKGATMFVQSEWRKFANAAGIVNVNDNPAGARDFIAKKYLDAFSTWPKEELLFLLTVLHTEIAMEKLQ